MNGILTLNRLAIQLNYSLVPRQLMLCNAIASDNSLFWHLIVSGSSRRQGNRTGFPCMYFLYRYRNCALYSILYQGNSISQERYRTLQLHHIRKFNFSSSAFRVNFTRFNHFLLMAAAVLYMYAVCYFILHFSF